MARATQIRITIVRIGGSEIARPRKRNWRTVALRLGLVSAGASLGVCGIESFIKSYALAAARSDISARVSPAAIQDNPARCEAPSPRAMTATTTFFAPARN